MDPLPLLKNEYRPVAQEKQVNQNSYLIALTADPTSKQINQVFPTQEKVTLDFELHDPSNGEVLFAPGFDDYPIGYFFKSSNLTAIDHHWSNPLFHKLITTTMQAARYVDAYGIIKDKIIVNNHSDADSILSWAILTGLIDNLQIYEEASISADHTGSQNQVADLLNGMSKLRDPMHSLAALHRLQNGLELASEESQILELAQTQRNQAQDFVESQLIQVEPGIYYGHLEEDLPGRFFPNLVKDAKFIILSAPMKNGNLKMKIRMGEDFQRLPILPYTLIDLDLKQYNFNGRWNAGSSGRGVGYKGDPWNFIADFIRQQRRLETNPL